MPFRFVNTAHPQADLRRLLVEQVDRAQNALAADRLRTCRTSCKRARAILLLCGSRKHDHAIRDLDHAFQYIAHAIASSRDHEAIAQTARQLAQLTTLADLDGLMRALACATVPTTTPDSTNTTPESLIEVTQAMRHHISTLTPAPKALWIGIHRQYRKARRRIPAPDNPSALALHQWRLASKKHWYHLRLCRTFNPQLLQAMADNLRTITDALGSCNDLSNLLNHLVHIDHPDAATLAALARAEHARLLAIAFDSASYAFALTPDHLVHFLRDFQHARDHPV